MGLCLLVFAIIFGKTALAQVEYDAINQLNQTGAYYLRNVMDKLQQEREEGQSVEIMELTNIINMDKVSEAAPFSTSKIKNAVQGGITAPTPLPPIDSEYGAQNGEPPLSPEELAAFYNAALLRGTAGQQPNSNHEKEKYAPRPATEHPNMVPHDSVSDNYPGYYYYFYPIKGFEGGDAGQMAPVSPKPMPMPMPHQSNVMEQNDSKAMEPLFMAITGFIGMALMFIFSVLFLPKFGNIRSAEIPELKEAPNDFAVLGKLVFESLDGKDCTERIACEVGRVVRKMRLEKWFKVMEIILPPNMSRQIGLIRSAAVKKEKCNFIPCRFQSSRPPAKTESDLKPWKKEPSPHELWMKHFEKKNSNVTKH